MRRAYLVAMSSFRALPLVLIAAAGIAVGGCGSSGRTTAASAPAAGVTSQAGPLNAPSTGAMPTGAMPTGAAGGGGTGKSMSPESTATLAEGLGVSPATLTAALTKARSNGAGVNLVKTLSSELNLPETKVAAALKAMGSNGP